MRIELDLTPAERDSIFFALRMRADRCAERCADPNASIDKVDMNAEESRRCMDLSNKINRLSTQQGST